MAVLTTNKFTMKHDLYSEIIDKIGFALQRKRTKLTRKWCCWWISFRLSGFNPLNIWKELASYHSQGKIPDKKWSCKPNIVMLNALALNPIGSRSSLDILLSTDTVEWGKKN